MPDLFDLPLEIRINIYRRFLVSSSPFYLFKDPELPVKLFAPDRFFQWYALLYTNRQIHREASAVLYGMNRFHFMDVRRQQIDVLRSFLVRIGPTNAASLSHLCLNFPIIENDAGTTSNVRIRDDSQEGLTLLRRHCHHLFTLELIVHFQNYFFLGKKDDYVRQALPYVDAQLRSISSLGKIIIRIEMHGQMPKSIAKEVMKELGWSVIHGDVLWY